MAKHTVGEWVDIYEEITLQAFESALTAHQDAKANPDDKKKQQYLFPSEPNMKAWGEYRRGFSRSIKRIKADFVTLDRMLVADMENEGPIYKEGPNGLMYAFWDPSLEPRVRFYWPDEDYLEFRGFDAVTACGFVQWWKPYCVGPDAGRDPKSRILGPGDPDFENYMNAKKADLS
jgi:hypothetical protein